MDFMTLFLNQLRLLVLLDLPWAAQDLSAFGKAVIIMTMFAGRVGPLTITLALTRRAINNKGSVKYPEDRIMVG